MTATMTAPRPRKAVRPDRPAPDGPAVRPSIPAPMAESSSLFDQPAVTIQGHTAVDMAPSEKLKRECIGFRLNFGWFSTSRQVDKASKLKMAEAADSSEDGFSASKRLMDSKHAVIKEANELQRRIKSFVFGTTIPLAGFVPGRGKPEPSVRLLEIAKIDEVDTRMNTFVPEVTAMEAKLNAALPDIKAMDRVRLKGVYRDEDYPRSLTLDLSWGFLSVDVPAALEKLAPDVYKREYARLQARMDETYELATTTVMSQFLDIVKDWTNVLGPVVKLYPPETHPQARYHGAEIWRRYDAGEHTIQTVANGEKADKVDITVPEGKMALLVRHYVGDSKKLSESVIGPMTQAEYANLQPSTVANAKRTFQNSTIEAMTGYLQQFHNVSNMISASENLRKIVKSVETHLAKMPDADAVTKELRNSATFKNDTHDLMTRLSEQLGSEITTFREGRLRIDRGGASR